jgi:acyl-CoA synthetase (AMP-forming)/AMP-acid ligase II
MTRMRDEAAQTAETVGELLRRRGAAQPDVVGFRFLHDGEHEVAPLTYGDLERRARAIAAQLQALTSPGDRALLLYPAGLDYVAAFLGCLYANVLAVPAYPPDPALLRRTLPRVRAIAADAGATVALTTAAIQAAVPLLAAQAPDLAALHWVATDALPAGIEGGWQRPAVTPDTIAFLQYTSGSNGTPKGVMVSHANLLHNIRALAGCCPPVAPGTHGVSWVPPYHDMGLIYGSLMPLYCALPSVLMAPSHFLERPLNWLRAITRYRGTVSGGTGFAFDLCVRRIAPADRAQLDLRSWRLAGIGGEPLRAAIFERFVAAFRDVGFDPAALGAGYGLAEATLMVTGPVPSVQRPMVVHRLGRALLVQENRAVDVDGSADGSWSAVACGRPLPDQHVLIVEPTTRTVLPPDRVGEIWVAGPSVAAGYWRRPDDTARTFAATLASGDGPFLRTGDLGFRDAAGYLYVVGRCKDLIIIRGTNHYPDDIEATASDCHPALRPGCGAAFSVELDDDERLVLVQEVRPGPQDLDAAERAIRRAVAEVHGLQVHTLVLLEAGQLLKTSSGKIARQPCRAAFPVETPERVRQQPGVLRVSVAPRPRTASRERHAPMRDAASSSRL